MPRLRSASSKSPVKTVGSLSERDRTEEGCAPRIVGAKIGSARSSGLLADDRKFTQAHSSADAYPFMTSDVADDVAPRTSGRDMYRFRKSSRAHSASGKETPVRNGKAPCKRNEEISDGSCRDKKPLASAGRRSPPTLRTKARVAYEESSASDEETGPVEPGGGIGEASSDSDNSARQKCAISGASSSRRAPARRCSVKKVPVGNQDLADDYFSAHHGKAGRTSTRTLSQLGTSSLDQVAMKEILESVPSQFSNDIQRLSSEVKTLFPYWLFQLGSGFNILLYGLGSKRRVMEDFCATSLSDACHVVINGFFPGFSMKHLLVTLSSDLLQHTGSFKSYADHCYFICHALCNKRNAPFEVFLVVHNIDGATLRVEKAQMALSLLSSCPHIHILASIDHINAPLIWDQAMLSRFNWIWHDVTLYRPYQIETSYENSLVKQSSSLAVSSITQVIKSLTSNARGIFQLLAHWQLEHHGDPSYLGLTLTELYAKTREKFLVNSETTLKTHLTEFLDHKLIRWKKAGDGAEYLVVTVDHSLLTHFLEHELDE